MSAFPAISVRGLKFFLTASKLCEGNCVTLPQRYYTIGSVYFLLQ
jgi:hypothetical protein